MEGLQPSSLARVSQYLAGTVRGRCSCQKVVAPFLWALLQKPLLIGSRFLSSCYVFRLFRFPLGVLVPGVHWPVEGSEIGHCGGLGGPRGPGDPSNGVGGFAVA